MTVRELRSKYIRFFESKGHLAYPSGSLIPYDVTGRLDESLLFNGAGMIQFKPYFRGVAQPENKRLTTCQKCVRTGDIESVGDSTHLTFFEMLGNFSFGDYFKAEAIAYSWEFLTSPEWLGLDPKRLSFTVFEDDDVAYEEWSKWISTVGLNPAARVFRLGEDTNYWPAGAFSAGPPGPCGPNSEMFYWISGAPPPGDDYTREDWIRDDAAVNWVEIWNDVFIQSEWQGTLRNPARPAEGYVKEGMPDLPFKSIDTGMGLDRTALVLGGYKTVYDTDAFAPILRVIDTLTPAPLPEGEGSSDETLRARRIIADHIRTAVFCIADGILPSNTGRGYVLRRLIRRAVLKGVRTLGIKELFFHRVYEGVAEAMGDHYAELVERRDVIVETLKNEEALFRRTLEKGIQRVEIYLEEILMASAQRAYAVLNQDSPTITFTALPNAIRDCDYMEGGKFYGAVPPEDGDPLAKRWNDLKYWLLRNSASSPIIASIELDILSSSISGRDAFDLYDTFGFPLEVTQEICAEFGVTVDVEGYEAALAEAQERSRGGQDRESVYGGVTSAEELAVDDAPATTEFTGYDHTDGPARIVRVRALPDGKFLIALDRTPFYAESGGQTGDRGVLEGGSFRLRVLNTTKSQGVFWHESEPSPSGGGQGEGVSGATLTPAPLPEVEGSTLTPAPLPEGEGSTLTPAPLREAEGLLGQSVQAIVENGRRARIRRNHTATHLLQAALRQTLGTHVTQAGSYVGPDNLRFDFTHGKAMTREEIETVERIVNEQALLNTPVVIHVDMAIAEAKARGAMALFGEKYGDRVRMVEIGEYSRELCGGTHVRTTGEIGLFKIVSEASAASGVRRIEAIAGEAAFAWANELNQRVHEAANLLKAAPRDLVAAVERTLEAVKDERKRREKAEIALTQGGDSANVETTRIGDVTLTTQLFEDIDAKIVAAWVDDVVARDDHAIALAALVAGGKVTFTCKVGKAASGHAGNLVREVAKVAGGGGGGRPDFATAGGKDPSKAREALAIAAQVLANSTNGGG